MDPVTVLLVGTDPLALSGLAVLLRQRDDLRIVGEARPDEAPTRAAAVGAAVLLWDLGVGGAAVEAVLPIAARVPVVALAANESDGAEALRAGVRSVLFRGSGPEMLGAALVAAFRGLVALDPELAEGWLRPPVAPLGEDRLTAREREVLALLAEGLGNKAIATRLGISEHTAKFHVNAILGKLGVESRAEAIVRAARMGLVVL